MAPDPGSYIAWDGMQYSGEPPAGWFLASDNRWWPEQDVIDATNDEVFSDTASARNPPSSPAPIQQIPDPPPPRWTRKPLEADGPTPLPQTAGPTRASRPAGNNRQSRRDLENRRQTKLLGYIVGTIILIVIVARSSSDDPVDEYLPSDTVEAPDAPAQPSGPSAWTDQVFTDDLDATLNCTEQGLASGTIHNQSPSDRLYRIDVEVRYGRAVGDDAVESLTEETRVGPIDPLEIIEWSIELKGEVSPVLGCEFESLTVVPDS